MSDIIPEELMTNAVVPVDANVTNMVVTMQEPKKRKSNKESSGSQQLTTINKRTKTKEIPIKITLINDKDRHKFDLVLEVDSNVKSKEYGKEFYVARYIIIEPTADYPDGKFDIDKLTIELLRKLCKNVGIANCGSHNKFNCRKAIATFFWYQDILQKNGLKPTTHADRVTSNICRAVNVVFSEEFIEDFKTINDRKSRQDHETKNGLSPKIFGKN
jgi:hypothetical protein